MNRLQPPRNAPATAVQEELMLSTVLSHTIFPGRTVLRCEEVANATGTVARHIRDLCVEGTIKGAFSVSGDNHDRRVHCWRIPVSAYDGWIKRKSNIEALQE